MRQWRLLMGGEAARLTLTIVMGVGAIASGIGLLATSAFLISSAALFPPIADLSIAIVAVRFFGISRGVFRYAERLASHELSLRVSAAMREQMANALTHLLPGRLDVAHSGDLLLRIISDADAWQHIVTRVVLPLAYSLFVVAGVVLLGWYLLPAAGLILLAALIVGGVALPSLASRLGRWSEAQIADDRRMLSESVVEMVDGAGEILAYGQVDAFLADTAAVEDRLQAKAARTAWVDGFNDAALLLATGITEVALLAVAIPAVAEGRLRGVNLAVVAILGLAAFEAVQGLPRSFQHLGSSFASIRRVEAVIASDVADEPTGAPLPVPEDPDLELDGVGLCYATRPNPVLHNVSLAIAHGTRVAVVGDNGAGKTSLAHILLRFREPDVGSYLVDGIPADRFRSEDLRSQIGLVDDGAFIFAGTVRENLRLGNVEANDESLLSACDRVGLTPWLSFTAAGLDTHITEDSVSGGERRRLAVARALLAGFSVLILDEPTAGLDGATARTVMADILAATRGKTVLLITHRSEGIRDMDDVLTLSQGTISVGSTS